MRSCRRRRALGTRIPRFAALKGFVVLRLRQRSVTHAPRLCAQAFGEEGKLVLHYASTPAWG